MILNKIGKPSIYLPGCMIIWGTISGATAATSSFGGLLTARFLLGFVEAAYFPGCLYYLSCWYTREELALRTGVLYSGSLLSGAFGGLIAAGILKNMDGVAGLHAWKWLFIIESVLTVSSLVVKQYLGKLTRLPDPCRVCSLFLSPRPAKDD